MPCKTSVRFSCSKPKNALYQDTASVVPQKSQMMRALVSPRGSLSLSARLRTAFGSSTSQQDITFVAFDIKPTLDRTTAEKIGHSSYLPERSKEPPPTFPDPRQSGRRLERR